LAQTYDKDIIHSFLNYKKKKDEINKELFIVFLLFYISSIFLYIIANVSFCAFLSILSILRIDQAD